MLKEQQQRLDEFNLWYADYLEQYKQPIYTGGDMFSGQDPEEIDISQVFTEDEVRRLENRGKPDNPGFPGQEIADADLQILALVARCYVNLVGDQKYPSNTRAIKLRSYIQFAENEGVVQRRGTSFDDLFIDIVQRIHAETL